MTPTESLALMEEHKAWFIHLARTHSQPPSTPLAPDEWSLIELLDHLITLERTVALTLARASEPLPPRTPEQTAQIQHYCDLLRQGTKYPVPEGAGTPNPAAELEDLLNTWEKTRLRITDRIQQNLLPPPHLTALPHPVAGPLNAEETLLFVALHLQYHRIRTESLLENQVKPLP